MKIVLLLLLFCSVVWGQKILFPGVTEESFPRYFDIHRSEFVSVVGTNPKLSFVPTSMVQKLYHEIGTTSIVSEDARVFLARQGLGESLVIIPELIEYTIAPRRRFVVASQLEGVLTMRYTLFDLATLEQRFTTVVTATTSKNHGFIFLRPLRQSVTITATDQNEMTRTMITSQIDSFVDVVEPVLMSLLQ